MEETELPPEQEIFIRKLVRKDVKKIMRAERAKVGIYSTDEEYDPQGEYLMDEKIIYGSS